MVDEQAKTEGPNRALRLLVSALCAVVVALGVSMTAATPASAHAQLVSSDPATGSTVSAPPAAVALTFNENVQAKFGLVKVTAPSGREVNVNEPAVVDGVVRQAVSGFPETGPYRASFRIISADGHPITGTVDFTYNGPVNMAASPLPASEAQDHGGSFLGRHLSHFALGLAGIALVVLVTVIEAFRKRRRQ